MDGKSLNLSDAINLLTAMPFEQKLLFGLAACTWIIGGNLLTIYHYRRRGDSWFKSIFAIGIPFKNYNKHEWIASIILTALSVAFAVAGMSYGR